MFGQFTAKIDSSAPASTGRHAAGRPAESAVKPAMQAAAKHPVIGVLGSKGGVGASTTALNLTAALSTLAGTTTLIDANLQQPDAAVLIGANVKYGLAELLERSEELDDSVVAACSIPIGESSPCRLISPPVTGEAGIKTQLSDVATCLASMRGCSGVWVIDLPKHLDRHLVTLMDKCDRIVVVSEPTLAAVHAARRWESVFAELGYSDDKIVWVLNRHGGKVKTVERELGKLTQIKECCCIPNAFETLEVCVARGETAVQSNARSPYSVAIKRLAETLMKGLV